MQWIIFIGSIIFIKICAVVKHRMNKEYAGRINKSLIKMFHHEQSNQKKALETIKTKLKDTFLFPISIFLSSTITTY